jgi:hypothetical protein
MLTEIGETAARALARARNFKLNGDLAVAHQLQILDEQRAALCNLVDEVTRDDAQH